MKQGLLLVAESEDEDLSIDEILSNYVGDFGAGQLLHFFLANLALVVSAMHILAVVFTHKQPEWRCKEISNSASTSTCSASLSLCQVDPSMREWVGGKHVSVVSEWELICDQSYKVGILGSIFFVGGMLGSGVIGHLSDKSLGRKGALSISSIILGISSLLTAVAPSYSVYLLCRALAGVGYGGIVMCCFVLSTEVIGPSKRGLIGMCAFYFFSIGTVVTSGLAYISSSSWRDLFTTISLPTAIYCVLVLPLLHESPRWYLVRGKPEESLQVLKALAKWNRNHIPANVRVCRLKSPGSEDLKTNKTMADLFRYGFLRTRMVVLMGIWFSIFLTFYTVSFNVVNIDFNLFVTVIINGVSEVPAYALSSLFISKFGRKKLLVLSLVASGMCCLVGSSMALVLDQHSKILHVGLLIIGALVIAGGAATYNLIYIYAMELFPTEVRNAALGTLNQAGQVGAVVAPVVVILSNWLPAAPFGIIGVLAVLAGSGALLLPETRNQSLSETIEEMSDP